MLPRQLGIDRLLGPGRIWTRAPWPGSFAPQGAGDGSHGSSDQPTDRTAGHDADGSPHGDACHGAAPRVDRLGLSLSFLGKQRHLRCRTGVLGGYAVAGPSLFRKVSVGGCSVRRTRSVHGMSSVDGQRIARSRNPLYDLTILCGDLVGASGCRTTDAERARRAFFFLFGTPHSEKPANRGHWSEFHGLRSARSTGPVCMTGLRASRYRHAAPDGRRRPAGQGRFASRGTWRRRLGRSGRWRPRRPAGRG